MTDLSSSIAVMAGIDSSCPLSVVCAFVMGYLFGLSHRPRPNQYSYNCPTDALVPYRPPSPILRPSEQKEPSIREESQPHITSFASETQKPSESSKEEQLCLPEQLLHEKVGLQMKKMQSTSFFEMRLEPSNDNKYMRKIQKHELVTDYLLDTSKEEELSVIPFKTSPLAVLSQPHSILELVAHQDYNLKLPSPLFERKFISMGQLAEDWKHKPITSSILENGRFSKFFRKSKVIGKGGFGSVFGAWSLLEQKEYAIKKIVMKGLLKIGEVMNEVSFISKYDHPNIVRYHTCWIELSTIDDALQLTSVIPYQNKSIIFEQHQMAYVDSNSGFTFEKNSNSNKSKRSRRKSHIGNELVPVDELKQEEKVNLIQIYALYIQMELCDGCLHSYLKNRTEVDPQQSFNIIRQLIDGIYYLHSHGIVHRDLKPGNILLNKSNSQVKIGDFGLAALVDRHQELSYRERVGTPLYIAPELNGKSAISKDQMFQVDIFSLGVIYFELLTLLHESTQHERSEKLSDLQFNKVHISAKDLKEEKKFIKLLTKTTNRPTIYEVKESKEYQLLREKYRCQ